VGLGPGPARNSGSDCSSRYLQYGGETAAGLAARSVPLDMRRTNPECPDSNSGQQSVVDFLFREEPDDEEEEDDGNGKDDDDDDAQDDGYSE
jgi:hypothetical protein